MFVGFLRKFMYFIKWGIQCKLLGKKIPLTCSLIITDKCNLDCKHCIVANLGYKNLSFEKLKNDVTELYNTGCRILVITGGEPFMWKNNGSNLDDVVKFAKDLGFFRTVVCTNGTFKLESESDYLWVSLDGFPEEHERLRNPGSFYKVLKNIYNSQHKNIYINFTINSLNLKNLENSAAKILNFKNVKGILFHLYTPYLGLKNSELRLSEAEKELAIQKIMKVKKKYPIKVSNTFDAIKALKRDNWERPIWASIVINQGEKSICCCRTGIYDSEVCDNCGCTPAVETWVLERIKPLAVLENLKFL